MVQTAKGQPYRGRMIVNLFAGPLDGLRFPIAPNDPPEELRLPLHAIKDRQFFRAFSDRKKVWYYAHKSQNKVAEERPVGHAKYCKSDYIEVDNNGEITEIQYDYVSSEMPRTKGEEQC